MKKSNKIRTVVLEWLFPLIIAFIIAICIKSFLVFQVKIPSGSMIPTLNVKDRLFVSKIYNLDKIERGDILVFYSIELEDTLIKRVIGLPGDKVEITDGKVSVNGEEIDESYVVNTDHSYGTYEVPNGSYFFLGDNRPLSNDARSWKNPYIDGKYIEAKAQIKVYPFSDFGWIE